MTAKILIATARPRKRFRAITGAVGANGKAPVLAILTNEFAARPTVHLDKAIIHISTHAHPRRFSPFPTTTMRGWWKPWATAKVQA